MIDLSAIKPKGNISDKFSLQLFRYIKKNPRCNEVYFYKKNFFDGEVMELDKESGLNMNQVVIGLGREFYGGVKGSVSGTKLSTIMGVSNDKYTVFSFYLYDADDFIDITEWFWEQYKKIGRCLFDRAHSRWYQGDKDRFTYVNNTRKCNWCGEWQRKEIEKEVQIRRVEKWI